MTQNVSFGAIAYTNIDTNYFPSNKACAPFIDTRVGGANHALHSHPPTGLRYTALHCNTKISMLHTEKLIRIPVRSRFQRCNMPLLLRICLTDL